MNRDPIQSFLQPQQVSVDVLAEKYCKGQERTIEDVRRRIAAGIASVEGSSSDTWAEAFYQVQEVGFVPAGRICSAAGTSINATLINCFVQPIADSVQEYEGNLPGIYHALREAAETMRRGGGVGYDYSLIRPRNSLVRGTASRASGPVSYMYVYDKSCETIESAGGRRGAQMGILRCDHPDVDLFIDAKLNGGLSNFNISVGVTDALVLSVKADGMFDLVHKAEPDQDMYPQSRLLPDGRWLYKTVRARDLWTRIMRNTYENGEPGVVFLDRINAENNLYYVEVLQATNPCSEQPLPPYGACCLGSMNLTLFVVNPFTPKAYLNFGAFAEAISTAVRFLDNVLDVSFWPLPQQRQEAMNKRRVGLGYLGLGSALVMLGLRYDSDEGRRVAEEITATLSHSAYRASIQLAKERGSFPLFDAEKYLQGEFVKRLPEDIRADIGRYGIRNSHLVSLAPTGTITLAFADNASNGIEPAFSWSYTRNKRGADGSTVPYTVRDHAYRLYEEQGHDVSRLPAQFVSALEMSAMDHLRMLQVVQPYIDSAISKTVNVPADYPFEDFENLYMAAWEGGLKGLATYRPNSVRGNVLSVLPAEPQPLLEQDDPDRRLRLDAVPDVVGSLVYPSRPPFPKGNMAWSFMMEVPGVIDAGLFVGQDDSNVPFEAWVNGANQPRGLGAIAKLLSIDMRAGDASWVKFKLERLARADSGAAFKAAVPGGEMKDFGGVVPYFAALVSTRCEELGAFGSLDGSPSPIMGSLLFKREPKSKGAGTMSWTWDVSNVAAGDDFVVFLKELQLPDGTIRPYSVWLSGVYPPALDGLCKMLSIDMWVQDPAWIGLKLSKLLNYPEAQLDFLHWVPGNGKQANYPSSVAYIAALILYRYKVLGLLDGDGRSLVGSLSRSAPEAPGGGSTFNSVIAGKRCPECSRSAYIKVDGCERCTACGHTGTCG